MKGNNSISTVLTLVIACIFAFFVFESKLWLLVAVILGLAGLISSRLSLLIHRVWMKLAQLLNLIVPNILLGIIYYLILFPLSLIAKLFGGKDPLMLKKPGQTTFRDINKGYTRESFHKPW